MVEEFVTYTPQDLADLNGLMRELSATSHCDAQLLEDVLADANVHVFVIREDGHIVATATLCVKHTLESAIAYIESVVVTSSCRGKGYGKQLMQHIIAAARRMEIHHIQLTSNPSRTSANRLYQDMGFVLYETNCYKLGLASRR